MGLVDLVAILLGLGWNVIAVLLLRGRPVDALQPGWLIAGAAAGWVAGRFAIASRRRRGGDEHLLDVLATYALGIVVYGLSHLVVERAMACWSHRGWTDFGLRDDLFLIVWLLYGAIVYGIVLVPLAFLSRYVLWTVHERRTP